MLTAADLAVPSRIISLTSTLHAPHHPVTYRAPLHTVLVHARARIHAYMLRHSLGVEKTGGQFPAALLEEAHPDLLRLVGGRRHRWRRRGEQAPAPGDGAREGHPNQQLLAALYPTRQQTAPLRLLPSASA